MQNSSIRIDFIYLMIFKKVSFGPCSNLFRLLRMVTKIESKQRSDSEGGGSSIPPTRYSQSITNLPRYLDRPWLIKPRPCRAAAYRNHSTICAIPTTRLHVTYAKLLTCVVPPNIIATNINNININILSPARHLQFKQDLPQ